jgi:hypothetical protein
MFAFLQGKKTYVVAVAAVVVAWYNFAMGNDANINDAIQLTFTALIGAFIRHGVSTTASS